MCKRNFYVFLGALLASHLHNFITEGVPIKELNSYNLAITAYQSLGDVYIDGMKLALLNAGNWSVTDHTTVPSMSRLIAVEGLVADSDQCAGILASVNDTYLLTDSSWKCSTNSYDGWMELGYDDSSWLPAVEYGSNGNHANCGQQLQFPDISSNAKWIWSDPPIDFDVYCRGYLPLCTTASPCLNGGTCLRNDEKICDCSPEYTGQFCETELLNGTLFITAFVRLQTVYIDGVNESLINGNMWNQTDRLALSATNRLIAVSAIGDGVCGGILASFGDSYVLTNAQWRCSRYQSTGWYNLGFDDESEYWFPAKEYGTNWDGHSGCSLQVVTDISLDASWIWVDQLTEQHIFCRGYTRMCDNSPCLNNGTCLQNEVRICQCPSKYTGTFCESAFCDSSPCLNGGTCLQNDIKLCSCQPQFTGTFCETGPNMLLTITAKSTLYELYIDGVPQTLLHGNNASAADEILLPPYGRLVAVTAIDITSTCAGVLASVTDDYLVTDASWKCETDTPPQWYTIGFDDSSWSDSYVIGPNDNVTWPEECSNLKEVTSISHNAYWIWTPSIVNAPTYDDIIYCRAYLPLWERDSPCQNGGTCNKNSDILCSCLYGFTGVFCESAIGRKLVITAKSTLHELYIDGIQTNLIYSNNWTVTDEIELSSVNRLISVLAVDSTSTCAGILASVTDDFLVTDAQWKCRIGAPPQWYLLGFDDSDWPDTYVIGPNANVSWPESCKILTEIPTVSQSAYWIWTSTIPDVPYYDSIIYCRAYLPICERESPCQNGAICNQNSANLCTCQSGFTGLYCESVVCNGDAPCLNGGTCNQGGNASCQCPPLFTGTFCEIRLNRILSITAKSIVYELYIDGIRKNLSNALDWQIPDEIELSPLSRLIGVSAMDGTETCAGIIASVTDEYLVTDAINWLCSYIPEPSWYRLGWDDSMWPPAYIVGPNNNVTWPTACADVLTGIPSISPNADWIWTDTIPDTPDYHQTIYCRGYLPLCELESPCLNGGTCNKNNETLCSCLVGFIGDFCEIVDTKLLTVTAKESLEGLYVDGQQVVLQNGADWLETDDMSIRSTSRLIAILAHQLNSSCIGPGILASVVDSRGDYVITGSSWKCSPSAKNGWFDLGYDDSTWSGAKLVKANNGLKFREAKEESCQEVPVIPSISPNAYWIWTDSGEAGLYDVVVYCRGYLPICATHPCKNGGTCNANENELCTCVANFDGIYCEHESGAT